MGFLKRHIRTFAVIAFTVIVHVVLLSFILGDVKAVIIGVAVILAVVGTVLALIGAMMLVGWILRKGRDTVATATSNVTNRPTSPKSK
jgi:hypothetical protein